MNSCWCEVLIHATSPSTGYSSGQNAGVYFSGVSPHRSWTSLSSAKAGREQSNHLGKGETTSAVPSAVGQSGTKEGKSPSESTKIQKIQRQGSPHVKHGTRQHPRGRGMFDLLMCFSPLGFFFPSTPLEWLQSSSRMNYLNVETNYPTEVDKGGKEIVLFKAFFI